MPETLTPSEIFEIMRPCFHYAKPTTPDGVEFRKSLQGVLLMKAANAVAEAMAARTSLEGDTPIHRMLRLHEPLDLPDHTPLRDIVPGCWPTVGDLRAVLAARTLEREGAA